MLDTSSNTNLNLPSPMNGAPSSGHTAIPQMPMQASTGPMPADPAAEALDKEWISKAKHIVEQTKQDPFIQSKEIGKVKADYLRIRFNKHTTLKQDHPS